MKAIFLILSLTMSVSVFAANPFGESVRKIELAQEATLAKLHNGFEIVSVGIFDREFKVSAFNGQEMCVITGEYEISIAGRINMPGMKAINIVPYSVDRECSVIKH